MSTITVLAAYELFDNRSGETLHPVGSAVKHNVCKFFLPAPPPGVELRDYAEVAARANISRIARKKYPNKETRYYMSAFTFSVDDPIAGDKRHTPWPQATVARKMEELLFNPSQAWAGALCLIHQAMAEEEQRGEQVQKPDQSAA